MTFAAVTERTIKEFRIDGKVVTPDEFVSQVKQREPRLLHSFDGHPEVASRMSDSQRWAIQ